MEPSSRVASRTSHNVALAYFADSRGVSDSVRDLCTANFLASSINISQSNAQQIYPNTEPDKPLPNAIGPHSMQWQWSRLLAHDWQRRGADQISGLNPVPPEGSNPTCSTFDLQVTLTAMRVPPVVIGLLLNHIREKGMYVLVDASNRVREAEDILDGNAGYVRTQYLRTAA